MDPKLMEILKRAKAVDKVTTQKFGGGAKPSTVSGGLYDQISGDKLITADEAGFNSGFDTGVISERVNPDSPVYKHSVENSKLPENIKKAMREFPIPTPGLIDDINENVIREINPNIGNNPVYREDDEKELNFKHPIGGQQKQRQQIQESSPNVDNNTLRRMIAEEIYKALPIVIEDYFDKRVLKEDIQFKAGNTTFSGSVSPLPNVKKKK